MRLYASAASPYAAKVRMAAYHCGIELEEISVDTSAEPIELTTANPLGKIPVVIEDDGRAIYDSRVICDWFDRISGNQLQPQTDDEWRFAKIVEALADGVGDALLLMVYEERARPVEKQHSDWLEKQDRKVKRGLAVLEDRVGELPDRVTIGHLAVAALLSWMEFRFEGRIRRDYPVLQSWLEDFAETFPGYEAGRARQS